MMAVVPSAPGSLLGLPLSPSTTLVSQLLGQRSGSPTMEYLITSPLTMEVEGAVISAELGAETGFVDVLIGQNEIDAIDVVGQVSCS